MQDMYQKVKFRTSRKQPCFQDLLKNNARSSAKIYSSAVIFCNFYLFTLDILRMSGSIVCSTGFQNLF